MPRRRTEDPAAPPLGPDADPGPHATTPADGDVFRQGRPARPRRQWGVLAAISLGGGLGSVARYAVSQALPAVPGHFPWATFLINVTGCFALGLLMVFVLEIWPPNRYVRPFLGIGFLGGYTTFSTFAVEVHGLAARDAWTTADAYVLNSLVAGLAAVWCGIALARLAGGRPVRRNTGRNAHETAR